MISVSKKASEWFKDEFDLDENQGIRITTKGYGNTNKHEGVSVSVWQEIPENPIEQVKVDGILYFIEDIDEWFIKDYDLEINFNEILKEPNYIFKDK